MSALSSLSPISTPKEAKQDSSKNQNSALFLTPATTGFNYEAFVEANREYDETFDRRVTPSPVVRRPLNASPMNRGSGVIFAPTAESVRRLWEKKAFLLLGPPKKSPSIKKDQVAPKSKTVPSSDAAQAQQKKDSSAKEAKS